MESFLSDLASWYWWLSVVLVGVLINLASAYVKPWTDRQLAARSERSQAKRAEKTKKFDAEISRIASDPALVLIAGQRLQNAQVTVLSVSTVLGFLIALGFFFGRSPPQSIAGILFQLGVLIVTVLLMILLLVFMRREAELDDQVRAARRVYEAAER